MSTRNPDRYEIETLDSLTGPIGASVRVVPLGDVQHNYEGTLRARFLTPDRDLSALVIDFEKSNGQPFPGTPRTLIRWAAIESVIVLDPAPEETPS